MNVPEALTTSVDADGPGLAVQASSFGGVLEGASAVPVVGMEGARGDRAFDPGVFGLRALGAVVEGAHSSPQGSRPLVAPIMKR